MSYPLFLTDHTGDQITERAASFILSLAEPTEIIPQHIEDPFLQNKRTCEYFLTRQVHLNISMQKSIATNQIKLYELYYKPAILIIEQSPKLTLNSRTTKEINLHIDLITQKLSTLIKGDFHPLNKTDVERLRPLPLDTPGLLEITSLIIQARELEAERPFNAPPNYKLKQLNIPLWQPDKAVMEAQTIKNNFFIGPTNQRFYVSPINKQTAREALDRAKASLLPFYKAIITNKLQTAYINKYYNHILYLQPIQQGESHGT